MQIEIQARNFPLTHALSHHVKRRLNFALSTRYEQIQRIQVRLSDINGPRGGKDKCCHIQVALPQLADVIIEDTESNLYVAIDRAAERTSRTVARRLGKQRNYSRTPALQAVTMVDDIASIQSFPDDLIRKEV